MHLVRNLFWALAATVLLSGCLVREGNPYNVGAYPHEWTYPGDEYEVKVFGPFQVEELREFVREMGSDGWEVCGFEPASLPEGVMVDKTELDRPSRKTRRPWTFDIPKTMDDGLDPPASKLRAEDGQLVESIPPYLDEVVKAHRQKYLLVMRRWQ
jgi:hypothetical protein